MDGSPPLLRLAGITKRFPGVVANDQVDLDVHAGQVHALLGENGAGKSTLMSILYGLYPPDSGAILLGGQPARIDSPATALRLGIALVPQHPLLVDRHSVAENLGAGRDPRRRRRGRQRAARAGRGPRRPASRRSGWAGACPRSAWRRTWRCAPTTPPCAGAPGWIASASNGRPPPSSRPTASSPPARARRCGCSPAATSSAPSSPASCPARPASC